MPTTGMTQHDAIPRILGFSASFLRFLGFGEVCNVCVDIMIPEMRFLIWSTAENIRSPSFAT